MATLIVGILADLKHCFYLYVSIFIIIFVDKVLTALQEYIYIYVFLLFVVCYSGNFFGTFNFIIF